MSGTSAVRSRSKRGGRARSEPRAICGQPKPRGGLCQRTPGQGTDHYGSGPCSLHGGNDPEVLKSELAVASRTAGAATHWDSPPMGMPIDMEPVDALLWCVKIAAGEVSYLTMRVNELGHDEVIARPRKSSREWGEGEKGHKDFRKTELGEDDLHILIRERQRAVDRLARLSKMALDAGVAERMVSLAEKQGDLIATVIERVVEKLSLTAKQMSQLEQVLPTVLLEMETGNQVLAS